jgi:hypothetical protein
VPAGCNADDLDKFYVIFADLIKESIPEIQAVIANLFREYRMEHVAAPPAEVNPIPSPIERRNTVNTSCEPSIDLNIPQMSTKANSYGTHSAPRSQSTAPSLYTHSNSSSQQLHEGSAILSNSMHSPVDQRLSYELPEDTQGKMTPTLYSTAPNISLHPANHLDTWDPNLMEDMNSNPYGQPPPESVFTLHPTDFPTGELYPGSMMQDPSVNPQYLSQ